MAELDVLTAELKTYCAQLSAGICALAERDLAGVESIGELQMETRQGSQRLHYCRQHKVYHLYTGEVADQAEQRLTKRMSAKIKAAYPGLSKAERASLQQVFQQERNRGVRLMREDRLRFSDWKMMFHNAHQQQQAHVAKVKQSKSQKQAVKKSKTKQSTGQVLAEPAGTQLRVRDGWLSEAAATLTATQRAEFYRCARKRVFAFEWQAVAALNELGAIPRRDRMSVYSCEFCSGWHMGHASPATLTGARTVDLHTARFAMLRYTKPAYRFLSEQGIANIDATC